MDTKFENCTINGGILDGAIFGDNNNIIHGNQINKESDNFVNYLDELLKISDSSVEKECAKQAKILYLNNDKKTLKDFIIENIATFTTGTFATVAGGLLLNAIQNILK